MIYASQPEVYPGAVEWPSLPCDLYDANGVLITDPCFYADTETGVTISYIPGEGPNGKRLTQHRQAFLNQVKVYAAPLRCVSGSEG